MILEGEASEILYEWVRGRYQIFHKHDAYGVFQIEIYEPETDRIFFPNEETEYFLQVIFES